MLSQVNDFDTDLNNDLFSGYKPLNVGRELSTFEDALSFDLWHEAMHLGIIKAQAQLIRHSA